MGWEWIEGDPDLPETTERTSSREVYLYGHLREKLLAINLRDGWPWLDNVRIDKAIRDLERAAGHRLMEVNESATKLLLKETVVDGLPDWDNGRPQPVRYIDWEHPENNDFVVINQFKVELTSQRGHVIPDIVFAMLQKYQDRDVKTSGDKVSMTIVRKEKKPGKDQPVVEKEVTYEETIYFDKFPVLNEREEILVLVDEAHRSHTRSLHRNLRRAMPNAAIIGFTGTPILAAEKTQTRDIFGSFIDKYLLQDAELDGATVPILYEGRTAHGLVKDADSLDQLFEDMFRDYTPDELNVIKAKYGTAADVLEAPMLIEPKARDMLRHYVSVVMPEGFKAQVVATSRRAAVI